MAPSKVEVLLAGHPVIRRYQIGIRASPGVVTLEGLPAALEYAEPLALGVPGVREVRARDVESPPLPPFVG
jgi:hypothetical protein